MCLFKTQAELNAKFAEDAEERPEMKRIKIRPELNAKFAEDAGERRRDEKN